MTSAGPVTRPSLRTPRAAAIAGIVFSLLLSTSLVLIRLALPGNEQAAGRWFADSARKSAVLVALYLVPYAGIAFLWFIGVVRDRMGAHEDRFFASVFLGSGLLFVAMLFASAAIAGGLAAGVTAGSSSMLARSVWQLGRGMTYTLVNVYGMRMAAVFMFSTATISLRIAMMPRWLALLGYACGLVLLLTASSIAWVELVFPVWVLVVSIYILIVSLRAASEMPAAPFVQKPV